MNPIASYIDHTLLKPQATERQVQQICEEARVNQFASVCVNPSMVQSVAKHLIGSAVKTCSVVGFPFGANTMRTKVVEAEEVLLHGAQEIDMVISIGLLKSGMHKRVREEISALAKVCQGCAVLKVILETGLLTDEEKVIGCALAVEAGADFVKTSTGFLAGGATVNDVSLMRKNVGNRLGVKASGGIKDYPSAIAMLNAGATRIGTSAGCEIVKGEKSHLEKSV